MKRVLAIAAAVLTLSGCATIINGKTQAIVLNSVPDGATAVVTNRAGEKVHSGTTPVTLTLNRGAGYFKPETYTIALTKDGHAPKSVTLTSTLSGWYIGNVLFGGLIGMLAVDPATGAMYTFPDSVNAALDADTVKTSSAPGSLTVVSTETLTAAQMAQARLVAAAPAR